MKKYLVFCLRNNFSNISFFQTLVEFLFC